VIRYGVIMVAARPMNAAAVRIVTNRLLKT
jgi:hypothetical protein